MKKGQINITFAEVSPQDALEKVRAVVESGFISEGRGIKHYCWATRFSDGIVVGVRQKKTKTSADSFFVFKESKRKSAPNKL